MLGTMASAHFPNRLPRELVLRKKKIKTYNSCGQFWVLGSLKVCRLLRAGLALGLYGRGKAL